MPEFLLAHLATDKGKPFVVYFDGPMDLFNIGVGNFLYIYEEIPVVGIEDPVCHYPIYFYLFVSLEEIYQIQTLFVECFVRIHYFDKG